jgi:hypothetical protein
MYRMFSTSPLQGEDTAAKHLIGGEVVYHLLNPLFGVLLQISHNRLRVLLQNQNSTYKYTVHCTVVGGMKEKPRRRKDEGVVMKYKLRGE